MIIDYPRFAWRGIMLDISRHFRDKEFILKQIDAFSEVKLNVLHLHLTDAAGWRLEVKSHPELTAKAAWRVGDTWRQWDTTGQRYEGSYGGFLSQDDVREIVAYAAERHMTVVPEIEMPGHSRETVYAVPGVGCKDTSDDLCPGKEATFKLLEEVLTEVEVMDLFPSEYIHIGGDEAGKRDWHDCPDCRRRMQEEGLTSVEELQSYLVRRIEAFLNAHGRRLIGWDEILEGGLSPNATVMSWRGTEGGLEAIRQGHDAVMTPGNRCYLDKVQDAPVREPEGWGGYLPIDSIYVYDPAAGIPEASLGHLLGVQGNLWHELIPQPSHTEYMLYPRAFAIAEIGWSPVDVKDAVDFRERAIAHAAALRERGYNTFKLEEEVGNRPASREAENHLGRKAKVVYAHPWHKNYPAAGAATLTDGNLGGWSYGDGRWQGFQSDVDVTVDLGSVRPVHYVTATFLGDTSAWIFLPDRVTVEYSLDGEHFTLVYETDNLSSSPRSARDGLLLRAQGQVCVLFHRGRHGRQRSHRHESLQPGERPGKREFHQLPGGELHYDGFRELPGHRLLRRGRQSHPEPHGMGPCGRFRHGRRHQRGREPRHAGKLRRPLEEPQQL